jgi:hypothetical protein
MAISFADMWISYDLALKTVRMVHKPLRRNWMMYQFEIIRRA